MESKPVIAAEVSDDSSSDNVVNKDCPEGRLNKNGDPKQKELLEDWEKHEDEIEDEDEDDVERCSLPSPSFASDLSFGSARLSSPEKFQATSFFCSMPSPSFLRVNTQKKFREMTTRNVGGLISRDSVPGQNVVIIRLITTGTTPEVQDDEEIPEEEAVCKYCFNLFPEENVFKTKCHCKTTLVHDHCRSEGNQVCEGCGHEVQNVPVILLRGPFSGENSQVGKKRRLLPPLLKNVISSHCFKGQKDNHLV